MMKYLFILACLLFLSGCSVVGDETVVEIEGVKFVVEEVFSYEDKYLGLSGRASLGENEGMLFVYDNMSVRTFVMRDMLFDLDMIWIAENEVASCSQNVSFERGEYESRSSGVLVDKILEVNSGTCERYGIEKGSQVVMYR